MHTTKKMEVIIIMCIEDLINQGNLRMFIVVNTIEGIFLRELNFVNFLFLLLFVKNNAIN